MSSKATNYKFHKKIKCLRQEGLRKTFIVKYTPNTNALHTVTEYDSSNMHESEKMDAKINAQLLKLLEHPNILKTKAFYETKNAKLCLLTEYIPGRSLSEKIIEHKGKLFDEDQILDWFTQICLAVKYLHDRHMMVRNLCTQNILITLTNIIKVQDMTVPRLLTRSKEHIPYLAPEVLRGDLHAFKADIWSLGVILYELCALSLPYKEKNLVNFVFSIIKEKYNPIPNSFSKELNDLVRSLLQVQPEERPGIDAVLENPIIKKRIEHFSVENIKTREDSYVLARKQVIIC